MSTFNKQREHPHNVMIVSCEKIMVGGTIYLETPLPRDLTSKEIAHLNAIAKLCMKWIEEAATELAAGKPDAGGDDV